jgi:hypothetical protein
MQAGFNSCDSVHCFLTLISDEYSVNFASMHLSYMYSLNWFLTRVGSVAFDSNLL